MPTLALHEGVGPGFARDVVRTAAVVDLVPLAACVAATREDLASRRRPGG